MPKRSKSEFRDPEKGPKTPVMNGKGRIRTPEVAKSRRALNVKKKRSHSGLFGSKQRKNVQKPRKEDIETPETKPYRYVTPQKKKRDESISTSNQTTSSEKVSPPRKRVNKI